MCQYHEKAKNWELALDVLQTLRRSGYEAYLVGGCVRDHLLGLPCEECDIATSAPPTVLVELYGPSAIPVGVKFGVVVVHNASASVEVATYRSEAGYADHRHPSIINFSTLEEDAKRRDFTINGLYWDPWQDRIIDLVEGRKDLERKLIRAIGVPRERFQEDALRILRALRFASSLSFSIDSDTWEALREQIPLLSAISMERIRDELIRGLTRPNPHVFLDLMDRAGVLDIILPEVAALKGCPQPPEFHPEGDVFTHTKLLLSKLPDHPSPALALAALLHDVGKPLTLTVGERIGFPNHDKVGAELADAICRRLRLPNALREQVVDMVKRHMMFIALQQMRPARLARFLAAPTIDDELELHRADCLASHGNIENYEFAKRQLEEKRKSGQGSALPKPLVTGHDLLALKVPPGPIYRRILHAILDAQLEGRITHREEALALAAQLAADFTSGSRDSNSGEN